MAKFEHGGLESTSASSKFEHGGLESQEQPTLRESQAFEDWLPYIGRNAAQLVTSTPYSLARSYGGLGNLMKGALEDLPLPEPVKNFLLAQQKQQMPSYGQAHEEAAQYLPKFAGEMRPGDELIQSLIPQAGLAYATGGLSSWPAAAETVLSSLGVMGGSQLGGAALQGLFPESKLAPELGSIAGGFAGGLGSRLVPGTGKSLMPTRALAPEKVLTKARPEQKSLYGTAEKLAEGVTGKPTKLLGLADDIEKRFGYGMAQKDMSDISKLTEDIRAATQGGINSPAGTMSLEEAKAFRREIGYRFKDINSPTMKHNLSLINDELKDFILEHGSSEHNKLWLKAEDMTKHIGALEKKMARTKDMPEWLKYAKGLSKLGVSPTLTYLSKFAGLSPKLVGGAAGLSQLAVKMFKEANYLHKMSKQFPSSFNKYLDTVGHAIKSDSPKVMLRLNNIAEEMNQKMPFEEEESTPE